MKISFNGETLVGSPRTLHGVVIWNKKHKVFEIESPMAGRDREISNLLTENFTSSIGFLCTDGETFWLGDSFGVKDVTNSVIILNGDNND